MYEFQDQHGRSFKFLQISKRRYEPLSDRLNRFQSTAREKLLQHRRRPKCIPIFPERQRKEAAKITIRFRNNWEGENLETGLLFPTHRSSSFLQYGWVEGASPRTAEEREGITTPGWWHGPAWHRARPLRSGAGRRGRGQGGQVLPRLRGRGDHGEDRAGERGRGPGWPRLARSARCPVGNPGRARPAPSSPSRAARFCPEAPPSGAPAARLTCCTPRNW